MREHRRARHWIDGRWVDKGPEKESINPATGEVIGTYRDGGAQVAGAAIAAAGRCFRESSWPHDPMQRATALAHLADAYAARLDDIVDTLCAENGKMRREAAYESQWIGRALRFAAGLAVQTFGRVLDPRPGQQSMAIRQPVGVAGLIIPWNSPAYLSVRALAPALAAGCTAVVKMPAYAAQTAALMNEIVSGVEELPTGAVNVFAESGSEGVELLVSSPDVPAISFTGSTHTGRLIARAAAEHLKRVGLELGGKTPHLVFDDADLEAALPVLEKSATVFAGQFCMTGSRVLAHRSIADELRAALAQRLEHVRAGPASDPDNDMRPMIDKANVARVDALVEEAIGAGAKPIVRGGPPADPELAGGAFYRPPCSRSPIPPRPSCRRRCSLRCRPSRSSTPRRRPSRSPTTARTGSAGPCGAGTPTASCVEGRLPGSRLRRHPVERDRLHAVAQQDPAGRVRRRHRAIRGLAHFAPAGRPLCPGWPPGTRFGWHLCNAAVLYLLVRTALRRAQTVRQ
ncbi:MAG: aldehyde dehydrogenase family protein [Pseudonocardia sp.]|nr:aldehyde dehydrogenase family protein [Pseudonocardia sp.]